MITPADARVAVGLGADASKDRVLKSLIDGATAIVGRELGRYLGPPKLQIDVLCGGNPPGHDTLFLTEDPLVDDDHPVVVSSRVSQFSAFVELDAARWALDGRELRALSTFAPGRGSTRVAYYTGYAVGTGPAELRDLVRQLVVSRYSKLPGDGSTDPNMQSETLGDYSYTRGDLEAVGGWRSAIDRWRRRLA